MQRVIEAKQSTPNDFKMAELHFSLRVPGGSAPLGASTPAHLFWSEYKLQAELNDARTTFAQPWIAGSNIRCFTDCSERGAVEIDVRQTEIRTVEDIDDFSAKLGGVRELAVFLVRERSGLLRTR